MNAPASGPGSHATRRPDSEGAEFALARRRQAGPNRSRARTLSHRCDRGSVTTDFAKTVNRILVPQKEIRVDASGEVSIHATSAQGPPTRDADELLDAIQRVIGDPKTTEIEFIHGDAPRRPDDVRVVVGSFIQSRVDLDDVERFGFESSHSRMGLNAAAVLAHEIVEQYWKQVHGEQQWSAHRIAYTPIERLLGAQLVDGLRMRRFGPGSADGEGTASFRYPDGRVVKVTWSIDFSTGNTVEVRREIRAPAR